jgi:hypothetical protein
MSFDRISVNGFSLSVGNGLYSFNAKKKVINGANYFLMRHGSTYKLKLTNDRNTKCDAEVWIDGEKVGVWRIEAYGSTVIERPAAINRKFVFLRENSSRAHSAGIQGDRSDNGLIKIVFKPAISDFLWDHDHDKYFMNFSTLVPQQRQLYGASSFTDSLSLTESPLRNTSQQNYMQNANVNYQFAAPLQNCISGCSPTYSHGATALGQRSDQDFDTATPIRDIDTDNITTIMTRLIVDNDSNYKPLVSLHDALHSTKYPSRLNTNYPSRLNTKPTKVIILD